MSEQYNGWSNRETWALHLHLTNTESSQDWLYGLARVMQTPFGLSDELRECVEAVYERALNPKFENGRMVESMSTGDAIGMWDPADVYRMISDTGSLWRINFDEIARNVFEERGEPEEIETRLPVDYFRQQN